MGLREIVSALFATQPLRGAVVQVARSPRGRRLLTSLSPRRGVYESFEEAWRAAGRTRYAGHDHSDAVELHARLADALMASDYPVLFWLEKIQADIRVFDYGGNMGNVYYRCAPYIDTSKRRVQWMVYDLPEVVAMARKLVVPRSIPPPQFTSSLQDADGLNVLLVAGAYHFWEKSTPSFLEQFPHLPEHAFINRSPFYEDQEAVISIKSEPQFAVPMIIRTTRELIDGFTSRGYELVDRWTATEHGHDMPLFPERSVKSYFGFYFRLRSDRLVGLKPVPSRMS